MTVDRKSYSAGHFLFQIDGGGDGPAYLKSVTGGMVKGAVLEDQAGPVSTQFKHLGAVEIEPIQLEVGMALSKPLLEWIRGSWQRQFSRRSGSIIHADFDFKTKLEQWFSDALITETKFPTLDGSAKEPAYLGVTLHPENVETKKGDGHVLRANHGMFQKLWQPSNFRLDIQGIDCRYVNKIDSFAVTQKVKQLYTGPARFPELEPTAVEFSNIIVYMALEHASDFTNWYDAFIMKGAKDTKQERDGFIEFLGPDTSTVLFTVNLNRLGIHRLSIEKSDANAEQIKRCKVELYVESMDLEYEDRWMK
ncbi:MAG TPA: phage tail protein [Kofleriaceae bacterium]|nr:phage tail protein [Kofleriaceae bacterium]